MASALLENLTAASTLAETDLFPVKQSGARLLKATGTQLLALVGTAYVPLAGGTMTGALLAANGSKTAPGLAFAGSSTTGLYWRSGILLAVAGGGKEYVQFLGNGSISNSVFNFPTTAGADFSVTGYTSSLQADGTIGILGLYGALSSTACGLRIGGLYVDSSNYERLALTTTAGSSVNITAESLGTGSANLDVVITPKGSGVVQFGTRTAIAAETVTGYITIKDAGGTTRKLAVVS